MYLVGACQACLQRGLGDTVQRKGDKTLDVAVGIKAAGGVAVLVFMIAWVKPFDNILSYAPNPISVQLPAKAPIRFIYDELVSRNGTASTPIVFQFDGDKATILNLRPRPVGESLDYVGDDWLEIFRRIVPGAPQNAGCANHVSGMNCQLCLDKLKWSGPET